MKTLSKSINVQALLIITLLIVSLAAIVLLAVPFNLAFAQQSDSALNLILGSAEAFSPTSTPDKSFSLTSGSADDLCTVPTYQGETDLIGRFTRNNIILPYRNTYEFRPVPGEILKLPLTVEPVSSTSQLNSLLVLNISPDTAASLPTDRIIKIKIKNYKAFCEGSPQVDFVSMNNDFLSQQENFILVSGNPDDTCSGPAFLGEESLTGTFIRNEAKLSAGRYEYEFVVDESARNKLPLQNIQMSLPWFNRNLGVENLTEIMSLVSTNLGVSITITIDKYSAYCQAIPTIRFKKNFQDVGKPHQFADAIQQLKSQDIVSGYPDGTFRPDQKINRAEFTKITLLTALTEHDMLNSTNCFSDLTAQDWFAKYVCTAKLGNLIKGHSDGSFKPKQSIILAEALKILMKINGINYEETHIWQEGIMAKAQELKLIPFAPADFNLELTRGQMAAITAKFLRPS